jgi:hypothetical protein
MGLSASPVVATVLGGFAAVLAGFLGITTSKTDPGAADASASPISPNASALRVLGFGFSCSLFLLAGIALRTHDLLAPPLSAQAQALNLPLLSPAEQKQLLFYKAFGLSAAAADGSHLTQADEKKSTAASGSSVLFATQAELCDALNRKSYASISDYLSALENRKGDYAALAAEIKNLPPAAQEQLAASIGKIVCD